MESAQAIPRAVARGISEATVNDTREALQTVLTDQYGGEKTYVWIRDFDDSTVWFSIDGSDDGGIFAQAYTGDDGSVELSGDRTEVRVKTTYVPATRPDSNTPTTEESEEDTMGKISIEESEHTTLTEKAGRVDALLTENANLKAEVEQLTEAKAADDRATRARSIVSERATEAQRHLLRARGEGLPGRHPAHRGRRVRRGGVHHARRR
jgi:ABC-type amino acid transport substrate-binding protein